jgi:5-methylcytosine-specific restriction endonuclease McrA
MSAVLLLNATLQPLNVISQRRLVVLLGKGRVAFLTVEAENDALRALESRSLPTGVVIVRLLRSIHVPRRRLRPNRRNLLLRDDYTCQYCGATGAAGDLTIDHIVPISRGGAPDRWDNVVVACKRCNWKKADRRPHEAGMRLRRKPTALTQEYHDVLFMRHPELKRAYDHFVGAAA